MNPYASAEFKALDEKLGRIADALEGIKYALILRTAPIQERTIPPSQPANPFKFVQPLTSDISYAPAPTPRRVLQDTETGVQTPNMSYNTEVPEIEF